MTFDEAHLREADPDLADDRARPRALHPLLPLHPLLGVGRRGRPARRGRARLRLDDRDLRRRALRGAVLRQRDRALPGRRADLDPVPLRGAGPGRSRTSRPSAASARSAATSARRPARARSSASSPATTPRSTRAGSATRAASPTRTCRPATGSRIRCARAQTAASSRSSGTPRSTAPRRCSATAGRRDRHRALGLRDGRAGLRARAGSCAPGSAPTRPCCPRRSRTGSTRSARRSRRSATRGRSSSSASEPVVERAPIVDLWIKAARRNGAAILTERPTEPVENAVLITDDADSGGLARPGPRGDRRLLPPAHTERPRRRRRLELRRRRRVEDVEPMLVIISGDEAAARPRRPRARRARRRT